MGQTTPNISIYIPTAGETGYDQSFAAGMVNIDQHDHSGAPNKGVPISSIAIADNSITFSKLNANVADNTTGIGTAGAPFQNQLVLLGLLKNIYANSINIAPTLGLLAVNNPPNSSVPAYVTITGTVNQIAVSNGNGATGNPTIGFTATTTLPGLLTAASGITFDSVNTLNSYTTNTFVPTLTFGGGSTGLTYTTQLGKYWIVGAIVYFKILIKINAIGSSIGNAVVSLTTLPNASIDGFNTAVNFEAISLIQQGIAFDYTSEVIDNTATIGLYTYALATGKQPMAQNSFASGSSFAVSGFYFTS